MTEYRFVGHGPAWREEYANLLADPERLLRDGGTTVVNAGTGRTVIRASLNGTFLAVKLFDESHLLDRLEGAVIGSSARRVGRSMALMRRAGLRVPALVALLEKHRGIARVGSCVVSEWIGGAQSQQAWATLRGAERYRFARALGLYMRHLHGAGVYPQDTSANNILACREGDGWQFVLVDLDRVRRYRRLSWRRRRHNLVQLQRSLGRSARPGEQLTFLRTYLGQTTRDHLLEVANGVLVESHRKDSEKGIEPPVERESAPRGGREPVG